MKCLWATQKWNIFYFKINFWQINFKNILQFFEFCKNCKILIVVFWTPILWPMISTYQESLLWCHKNIGSKERTWERGLVLGTCQKTFVTGCMKEKKWFKRNEIDQNRLNAYFYVKSHNNQSSAAVPMIHNVKIKYRNLLSITHFFFFFCKISWK